MRFSSRFSGIAVVSLAALAISACHGGPKGVYKLAPEQRPLEVPPDLSQPDTHGGTKIPALPNTSSGVAAAPQASATAAPLPAGTGFSVSTTSAATYNKLADALAAIGGATVNSSSPILSVYDVSYAGSDVLLRVSDDNGGAQIAATDPRGQPATGDAALKLVAALKTYFGVK